MPNSSNKDKKSPSEIGSFNISRTLQDSPNEFVVGVWKHHSDESQNLWSNQTYRILSLNKENILPNLSTIVPYIDTNFKSRFLEFVSQMNDNHLNDYQTISIKYKGPDNIVKDLLFTSEAICDNKGNLLYWQGTIQDISNQKSFQHNLAGFGEDLFGLLKQIPTKVFALDSQGVISFWNNQCETATGYKSSEIVGNKDAFKLLFPDHDKRNAIRLLIKEMGSKSRSWEYDLTTKGGIERLIRFTAIRNSEKNDRWSIIVVGQDISKLKKAISSQTDRANNLEVLVKTSNDFMSVPVDDNYYRILGSQLEQNINNCLFVVCSADNDQQFFTVEGVYGIGVSKWHQVLEALGWNPVGRRFQVFQEIYNYIGRGNLLKIDKGIYEFTDGIISSVASRNLERLFSIENIYTMGFVHNEKFLGGLIVLSNGDETGNDLSLIEGLTSIATLAINRKNIDSSNLAAKNRAEEADRQKTIFLANLSHEIRVPMNAILGFSQLLNLPNLTRDKRQQYIDIINSKGKILVKLINDIIDASKVESGELTLVHAPFKLNSLLNSLKTFYDKEKVFQEREAISIKLIVPQNSDDLEILSDEGRLEQVLTNLLGNALKFTEKGHVEFGYSVSNYVVEFFVKDTGVGIDEKAQEFLFNRFSQAEEKYLRTEAGTGLGLAISKGIVELLGGKIWVESSPGEGATFKFTIPYIEPGEENNVDQYENSIETIPDWKNKVLLVAEDEDINYMYISELLTPTGVKFIWAKDGAQAVELVNTIKNINAILMDIKMPVMNGYAATLEIRQINPHIPIIAQTAYAYTEDRSKAEAAGCDDYITKPINSQELFEILDKYLG